MKYLVSLLFILFLSHNANAGNLCDESCDFIITFPEGGSIDAIEDLTITFAGAGFINDGVVTIGYADGETVFLAAGESLVFSIDGALTLGAGGNIDYTDMVLNSSGNASLTALGGTESINIIEKLTISGGMNVTFNGDVINISGTLQVDGGILNISGNYSMGGAIPSPSLCSTQNSTGTLTLTSSVPLVTTGTCSNLATTLSLPVNEFTLVGVDPNVTLISVGTITPTSTLNTIDIDDITVTPVESEDSGGNGVMGWFLFLLVSCFVCCRKAIRVN